jgi:predicted porin
MQHAEVAVPKGRLVASSIKQRERHTEMKLTPLAVALTIAFGATGNAFAADSTEVQVLRQQMETMQKQMAAMQNKLDAMAVAPAPAQAQAQKSASSNPPLTANFGGATATLYGHADLSVDVGRDGTHKVTQVSSNLSYVGIRATRALGTTGLTAIAQIETLANISATPTETGGFASRNSFLGLQGGFGKIMLGKTDTPYKRATAMMDPFSASVGDYNSIMGNTGGDLRAEFDPRLPHSIFYDSAKFGGFSVNALYSPGQKFRNLEGSDKYRFAQGEKVCSGATPGSSGSTPDAGSLLCNDGAFTRAVSVAVNYASGPVLGTVSYERHKGVDRTGDTGGVSSDESAAKIGLRYDFGSNQLAGIYEKFYRGGGIDPAFNERARSGYYISDVQQLGNGLEAMAAWAHAGSTPGGPDFGTTNDKANMYAVGLKYHYDKQTSVYLVGAMVKNGPGAHYALGAGGHGVPIASPRNDTGDTIAGQNIKALSVGMQFDF